MILVDTSIWIDHLRIADRDLTELLEHRQILGHPWIVGEVALGQLAQRTEVVGLLKHLPQAVVATEAEVLSLIESAELHGSGIGFVDAQLVASTRITPEAVLWTRDKRLARVAQRLGVSYLRWPQGDARQ